MQPRFFFAPLIIFLLTWHNHDSLFSSMLFHTFNSCVFSHSLFLLPPTLTNTAKAMIRKLFAFWHKFIVSVNDQRRWHVRIRQRAQRTLLKCDDLMRWMKKSQLINRPITSDKRILREIFTCIRNEKKISHVFHRATSLRHYVITRWFDSMREKILNSLTELLPPYHSGVTT